MKNILVLFLVFILSLVLGLISGISSGEDIWEGKLKRDLSEGGYYHVLERWSSAGPPVSFLLKLNNDEPPYERGLFYQIDSNKIRDEYLKKIPLDEIPLTFKLLKKEVVLPENLPSLKKEKIFILKPVSLK